MIPLRAESSTVSLPPWERALAKHRAKAIKLGLPPSIASKSPAKGIQKRAKPPVPPPTLAATRQRRAAADVAYLDRPDGYHIKRVVRRVSPGPAPPVPYLPGEEDIPRSDTESEDSDAQVPELAALSTNSRVAIETEDTPTEPDSDLVDYDAEGEDEDGDRDTYMQYLPPANHSFSMGPECAGVSGSMPGVEATSATNPFVSGAACALLGFLDSDSVYALASAAQYDSGIRASCADAQPPPFTLYDSHPSVRKPGHSSLLHLVVSTT
ncbi:hypothetical protein FRC10_001159 [Ceratobasidium sp. 414]|nr:hypothetical protein FRC10_001159 [Ceratobasidium sp. 414]